MNNNDLNLKILDQIKSHHIKPRARWKFLLKNYLTWTTSLISLIISAASFATMLYLLRFNDLTLKADIKKSSFEILFLTLPYFWIFFLIIFIFLIYYNIKKTKSGYRYPIWLLSLISLFASIFLGSIFFMIGWGDKLDQSLSKGAPFYSEMMNPQMKFWSNPKEGRLLGLVITDIDSNNNFQLLDKDDNVWLVKLSDLENSEIIYRSLIKSGQPVRLLGTQESIEQFLAFKVLPVGSGRHFFERNSNSVDIPFHPGSGWRHQ